MRPSNRTEDGWTLPELLAVSVLISIAAAAVLSFLPLGRSKSYDLEAAATIEAVMQAATTVWSITGELSASGPHLEPVADPPVDNPSYLISQLRQHVDGIDLLDAGRRTASDTTGAGSAQVTQGQISDTASVAWIPGRNAAAIGVAARSATGACLLSRIDLGDRAGPQRFGIIDPVAAADETLEPCQGDVALALPETVDEGRAGASWANPTRVRPDRP